MIYRRSSFYLYKISQQKIFIGGKFYHPISTNDIRSLLVGSIDLQIPFIQINSKYIYIGPFFSIKASQEGNNQSLPQNGIGEQYNDNEHKGYIIDHKDEIILEEMNMIERSDIFICVFLDQSPGTIVELIKATNLGKRIYILSTKDLYKENWYIYRWCQLNSKNDINIINIENIDQMKEWFQQFISN